MAEGLNKAGGQPVAREDAEYPHAKQGQWGQAFELDFRLDRVCEKKPVLLV